MLYSLKHYVVDNKVFTRGRIRKIRVVYFFS